MDGRLAASNSSLTERVARAHLQTARCISSAVGTRPSGVNLSTTFGKRSLRPARSSSRDRPVRSAKKGDLLVGQHPG